MNKKLIANELLKIAKMLSSGLTQDGKLVPQLEFKLKIAVQTTLEMKKEVGQLYNELENLKTKIKKIEDKFKLAPTKKEPLRLGLNKMISELKEMIVGLGNQNEVWEGIIDNARVFISKRPSQTLPYKEMWEKALSEVNENHRKCLLAIQDNFRKDIAELEIEVEKAEEQMKVEASVRVAGFLDSIWKAIEGLVRKIMSAIIRFKNMISDTNDSYEQLQTLVKTMKE